MNHDTRDNAQNSHDLLFIGTYGHVRALDKKTGQDRWQTNLSSTGYEVVTLLHEDGVLFAGTCGHVFALDAATGVILWRNDLIGLSHKHMTMATTLADTARMLIAALAENNQQDASAAS
jgi:outer membrane protein assembly factor BamB